jgi:hypothetical protein
VLPWDAGSGTDGCCASSSSSSAYLNWRVWVWSAVKIQGGSTGRSTVSDKDLMAGAVGELQQRMQCRQARAGMYANTRQHLDSMYAPAVQARAKVHPRFHNACVSRCTPMAEEHINVVQLQPCKRRLQQVIKRSQQGVPAEESYASQINTYAKMPAGPCLYYWCYMSSSMDQVLMPTLIVDTLLPWFRVFISSDEVLVGRFCIESSSVYQPAEVSPLFPQ